MYVWQLHEGTHSYQKKSLDSLGQELQVIMSCLTWVLWTKPRTSARALSALNYWDILPATFSCNFNSFLVAFDSVVGNVLLGALMSYYSQQKVFCFYLLYIVLDMAFLMEKGFFKIHFHVHLVLVPSALSCITPSFPASTFLLFHMCYFILPKSSPKYHLPPLVDAFLDASEPILTLTLIKIHLCKN